MSEKGKNGHRHVKALLLGPYGVGKTTLIGTYHGDAFDPSYRPTVCYQYFGVDLHIGGDEVDFQIYDTAGAEEYQSMMPLYYRGADAVILVFDLARRESFEEMKGFHVAFTDCVDESPFTMVVANKLDIVGGDVDVLEEKQWADEQGFEFFLASAKDNIGVTEVFNEAAVRGVARQKEMNVPLSVEVVETRRWCAC